VGTGRNRSLGAGRIAAGAGLTAGATLALAGSAEAATFNVTTLADSGPGSLRQAFTDSQASAGADTITFASGLSGTITLASSMPILNQPLTIQGPGPQALTINANNQGIFQINANATDAFNISGLTLTGATNGGPISSSANLTVSNCVISNNVTPSTPLSSGGPLHLLDSAVVNNTSRFDGPGGVFVGGNANFESQIRNSTISGNSVPGASPGYLDTYGGGVYVGSNTRLTITDSTISGNSVRAGQPGGNHHGGGISVYPGGGMYQAGRLALQDTIVAGNIAVGPGPDIFGNAGAAFSLIGNTSGANIVNTVANSNITGADPQLGPVAANGGSVPTQALSASSPALDKGAAFGLANDGRGLPRPLDCPQIANSAGAGADGSDIGAFELQPASGFKFGKLKRKKSKGTAKQTIQLALPDLGTLKIFGKGLKSKTIKVGNASGTYKLAVKPKAKLRRRLKSKGKAKLTEKATYTPQGGPPLTLKKKIKLLKR